MGKIAFFDFDGTLTYKDSVKMFYKSLYKSKVAYFYFNYILCSFEIVANLINKDKYINLKRKRFFIHLNKLSNIQFEYFKSQFINKILPKIIKQSGLECILDHKKNGDVVCIVSASFDFLLEEWCDDNDIFLITNKTFYLKNRLNFDGNDCNFENKVSMINRYFILKDFDYIYAYGDSKGDMPMLSLANESYYNYFN